MKHGANMDAQDNEGWSPLHAAASCGHNHIVRYSTSLPLVCNGWLSLSVCVGSC